MTKVTPAGTHTGGAEYWVQNNDTLEGIAARCDCTPSQLMKLNKLSSRLLFPGQKILVPYADSAAVMENQSLKRANEPMSSTPVTLEPTPINVANIVSPTLPAVEPFFGGEEHPDSQTSPSMSAALDPQLDADCLQRFLKLPCKHFTDSEGVVSGILLVTPNCIMFDPDVSHPLVIENGADRYGMVVAMQDIVSAALYKNVSAMTGEKDNSISSTDPASRVETSTNEIDPESKSEVFPAKAESTTSEQSTSTASTKKISDTTAPALSVNETTGGLLTECRVTLRRHVSDSGRVPGTENTHDLLGVAIPTSQSNSATAARLQAVSCPSKLEADSAKRISCDEEDRLSSDSGGGSAAAKITSKRPSLNTLRANLRKRANTLGGTLVQGAQAVGSGVGSLGGTLVQGAQVVQGTLTYGAKAMAKMPQNLVNMSSGLFAPQASLGGGNEVLDIKESWFGDDEVGNAAAEQIRKRQQNYALLARLQQKTAEARQQWMDLFACATTKEEYPNLFAPVEDMLPYPRKSEYCTELPYYLCIRLDEKRRHRSKSQRERHEEFEFGNKTKSEFWFTVPRDKADTLYAFLIQWTPESVDGYGGSSHNGGEALERRQLSSQEGEELSNQSTGFVVLDVDDDEAVSVNDQQTFQPDSLPGSLNLNREWEIVTVEEVKRRLSLLDLLESEPQPLPDGSDHSLLLNEEKIRHLMDVLPARAQGYPWLQVYSSELHGFSLRTLYRNMQLHSDEMSPTLLVIKDTSQNVFGAVVNCPLRISEHFYGSGESILFSFYPEFVHYRWSGENNFVIKGNQDSLLIGAGRGVFGLWLDGDLYHGRTQRCQTFNNDPLTSTEDFTIAGVEAWGFSLNSW